jgi:hypothetical protein
MKKQLMYETANNMLYNVDTVKEVVAAAALNPDSVNNTTTNAVNSNANKSTKLNSNNSTNNNNTNNN